MSELFLLFDHKWSRENWFDLKCTLCQIIWFVKNLQSWHFSQTFLFLMATLLSFGNSVPRFILLFNKKISGKHHCPNQRLNFAHYLRGLHKNSWATILRMHNEPAEGGAICIWEFFVQIVRGKGTSRTCFSNYCYRRCQACEQKS